MKGMASGTRGVLYVSQRWTMAQLRASSSGLGARKCFSVQPWLEESSDVADAEEGSSSGSRGLDQVLREFRIQKATPNWLPLLPGGSFWVPPDLPEVKDTPTIAMVDPATEGELFAMIMPSGWPAPSSVEAVINTFDIPRS